MRQSGANQVMPWHKARGFHLLHGLLRGPALLGHAISRDHHSCTIIPQAAVDEYLLGWILAKKQKEACEYFVLGKGQCQGIATYCIPNLVTRSRSRLRDPRTSMTILIPIFASD